ncbi:MAG: RNA polymerase sigma factor [Muribaculaceae bacterium]|nr:RNA polymerase sigma factor [Muribaculaceae bacterium]
MDEVQFKRHILSLSARMYAVAYSVTGNEDDAKDAAQNATIKLWEQRHLLPEVNNLNAFTLTVTRNAAIDIIRSRREHDELKTVNERSGENDPEQQLERSSQVKQVLSIIEDLPPAQRLVITMRDVQGYELKEIEEVTGQNNANVRKLLSRARLTIRKHFIND